MTPPAGRSYPEFAARAAGGRFTFTLENAMFEVTENAFKELDAYFDGKEKSAIRVYLAPGGCSGPRLALALDEPTDSDTTFDEKGYSFVINNDLFTAAKNIKVDFTYMGFSVESEIPLGGGGGCSGCGGGCGPA